MTNLEGRVIRRRGRPRPPTGVRGDIDVLRELADRLGCGDEVRLPLRRATVFDEFRRATAGGAADYSGITYERIDAEDGVFWPCPSEDHPGTPRLFAERFHHAGRQGEVLPGRTPPGRRGAGRGVPALLHHRPLQGALQLRRPDPPGRQARPTPQPPPRLQIHPRLARRHGVVTGSVVVLESRRGRAEFAAESTADIRPDTLFAPFHWGGREAANLLTNPALDPTSRMPEFKLAAVRIAARRRRSAMKQATRDHRQRHGRRPAARRAGPPERRGASSTSPSSARSRTAATTASCSAGCSPAATADEITLKPPTGTPTSGVAFHAGTRGRPGSTRSPAGSSPPTARQHPYDVAVFATGSRRSSRRSTA